MKRMCKRLLCLLLTAVLVLAVCPAALALENGSAVPAPPEIERTGDGSGGYIAMMENSEEPGEGQALLSQARTFAASGSENGDFYSQLTTRQKACYDALTSITIDRILTSSVIEYGGKVYRRILTNVSGMTGSSIGGSVSGGVFYPSASGEAVESGIYTDLCAALVALRYDHPEMIWTGMMRYGYHVTTSGSSPSAVITNIVYDFYMQYGGQEKEYYNAMMTSADIIADTAAQQPDTFSRVKALHDILAASNSYGRTEDSLSHTAYSALIADDEHDPVCDGYSKAFKMGCDRLGIPCVLVSSDIHMWNNVKMDDGLWYNLDLTWDDSGNVEGSYEYFLVGSQTLIGGKTFSEYTDHVELNPYEEYRVENPTTLQAVTLRFPTKSKTDYSYLGEDYPPTTFPDVKRGVWYYGPIEVAAAAGLFSGDNNGLFHPDKNITRAEVAVVIANALGVTPTDKTTTSFTDVAVNKWYTAAINWVKEQDIMVGSGGKFRPNDYITRQEMCVVIYKLLGHLDYEDSVPFPDDAKIASWAKTAVYQCKALYIVQGDNNGYFNPLGNTQRSAAAVIFTRYIDIAKMIGPEDTETDLEEAEELP